MDDKRGSVRLKRQAKVHEDDGWECSVCTYKNAREAFKCDMCDVRKGTATRKPKINPTVVQQQVTVQQFVAPPPKKERSLKRDKFSNRKSRAPRLKNIDRSSGRDIIVTVNDVTVVVTDYKAKEKKLITESNSEMNSPDQDEELDFPSGSNNDKMSGDDSS